MSSQQTYKPEEEHKAAGSHSTRDPEPPSAPLSRPIAPSALADSLATALKGVRPDMVTMPAHYARLAIEPTHFIVANKLDWFQGNVIKYTCRTDFKDGIQDMQKAIRYLQMRIKYVQGDPDWWKAPVGPFNPMADRA